MAKHTEFLVASKNPILEIVDREDTIVETFKSLDDAETALLSMCEDGEEVIIYQLTAVKVGKVSTEPTIDWKEL